MKRCVLSYCIMLLIISNTAHALQASELEGGENVNVVSFFNALKSENVSYYSNKKIEFYSALAKGQYPAATVVTCSDSRVQTIMFSANPEGKLFVIRNIGNQIATAEGSVEYGIHHLHTPILLVMGHSRCGAIAAVTGNYSKESAAIRRELDTITIGKDLTNMAGVKANVHNQVASAMLKFDEELKEGKLTVVGAIMDFADDLHQGAGKLHIINVNGETDANKLANLDSLLTRPKVITPQKKTSAKGDAPETPKQRAQNNQEELKTSQ